MLKPRNYIADGAFVVEIKGNKKHPEKATTIVKFPGGDIELSRVDAGYWVHVRIDHPEGGMFLPGVTVPAQISKARIDAVRPGHDHSEQEILFDESVTHMAFLVEPRS